MAADLLRTLFQRTEFLAGLFVIVLGAACLAAVGDLEIGTAVEMGPGYVPRALAVMMLVSGAIMAVTGARRSGIALPDFVWRPVVMVSLAVALFGALVDRFGIVLAVVVCTAVASLSSSITRHRETPILCIALALLAAVVFVKGLGLAIPIWPR